MRHVLNFVISLVFLLTACNSTPATHWQKIEKAGKLVIGTSADYPPFEYIDEKGEYAGFEVEIMRELTDRLGLKLEIIDMPFDRLIDAVQSGKVDIAIATFNYSTERDKVIDFTAAYYYQENGFLVRNDFAGQIAQPEDIVKYIVGVQTGSMAETWVNTLAENNLMTADDIYHYDRIDQAGQDVQNGRIDILMADYYPLLTLQNQYTDLEIIYHGDVAAGPMMMVIPEGDWETKATLDKTIKSMLDDGFVDQAATKYFSSLDGYNQ